MNIRFEWDASKATSNLSQHRVSFETASRVFADPFLLVQQDRVENGERRWQSMGMVDGADSKERKRYEQDRQARG